MATEGIYIPLGGTERRVMLFYSILVFRFTLINIFFGAVVAIVKLLLKSLCYSFPFLFPSFPLPTIYIYIYKTLEVEGKNKTTIKVLGKFSQCKLIYALNSGTTLV